MIIALPSPFDQAELGAHVEHHRRQVTLNLAGPGKVAGNGYERCWVDITEREAWRGEPLWLSASRRPLGKQSWGRVSFTDRGRERLEQLLLPVVARYGFNRLWLELHRRRGDGARQAQAQAEREAAWWGLRAELGELHAEGLVEFRPLPQVPLGERGLTMPVLSMHHAPADYEQVTAEAIVDGERLGWMTDRGHLVPDRTILDKPAKSA